MTTPTRRPVKLRPVLGHVKAFIAHHGHEIEFGISCLLDDLAGAGWPDRTPDDDRKPRPPSDPDDPNHEPDVLDYTDPTGEMAAHLDRLHGDREAFEDHRQLVETSLRAMELIARRYRPTLSVATVPACSLTTCTDPVESRRLADGTLSYVGMILIAGAWVAKPGSTPKCVRHRKQEARRAS